MRGGPWKKCSAGAARLNVDVGGGSPVPLPGLSAFTFHIVYVPGTVRYLRLGVQSLLRQGESGYALVGNGLDAEEAGLLAALAEREPRVRYLDLGVDEPLKHGRALNRLAAAGREDPFAFMDSDISRIISMCSAMVATVDSLKKTLIRNSIPNVS